MLHFISTAINLEEVIAFPPNLGTVFRKLYKSRILISNYCKTNFDTVVEESFFITLESKVGVVVSKTLHTVQHHTHHSSAVSFLLPCFWQTAH
jgi:hypothetical protein